MNKYIKLAAAVSAALATQFASAGTVTMYGDGGVLNMPTNFNVQVASVFENPVLGLGQELKGYGEISSIAGYNIGTLCTNCELTFTFDSYITNSLSANNATFTGGKINVYLGFGANNDFNPTISGSSAADLAAATNGALFLTLKGHDIAPGGITLQSFVGFGSLTSPSFSFFGNGLWDVDMTGGGLANTNFNTDTFNALFGSPTADLDFNSSGSTTRPAHAAECAMGNLTSCVVGSADIGGYVIPEPGTLALAGLGLMGLGLGGRRRKQAA